MSTLYWLNVLGALHTFFLVFAILSGATVIISIIAGAVEDWDAWKKALKISSVSCIICWLGCIFIPSTKELYLIYGVGSTIDYLKDNPTAKQLPDKYIEALDKWADEAILKQNNSNNNNN